MWKDIHYWHVNVKQLGGTTVPPTVPPNTGLCITDIAKAVQTYLLYFTSALLWITLNCTNKL